MDLDEFLKQAEDSAPRSREDRETEGEKVEFLFMSAPTNQGTLRFIPICPVVGSPVRYVYGVSEWQVLVDEDTDYWKWGKALQLKDYVSELTKEQQDKISKIHSLVAKAINELGYESDWGRTKNYALIFGYILSHVNKSQEVLVDGSAEHPRKMALIVLPSKNVASKMKDLARSFSELGEGGKQLFADLYNRESKRKVFMEMSFILGGDGGFGYTTSISAKPFDIYSSAMLTDAEKKQMAVDVPEALIEKCICQTAMLVAGNRESKEDYNDEFVDQIIASVEGEVNKTIAANEAKNNLPPKPELPNNNTPSPSVGGWPTGGQ